MSARHRLPVPERPASPPRRRGLTASRANVLIGSIAASVAVAGIGSAAIVELAEPQAVSPQTISPAQPQPTPVGEAMGRPMDWVGAQPAANSISIP